MPAQSSPTGPTPAPMLSLEGPQAGQHLPLAVLAGWVVPGLGHYLAGQVHRGLVCFVAITGLWVMSLVLAGIGIFAQHEETEWLLRGGRITLAPTLMIELAYQVSGTTLGQSGVGRPLAAIREQGVLFLGLAGYLNLMVLLDLIMHDPSQRRGERFGQARVDDADAETASPDAASPAPSSDGASGANSEPASPKADA